MIFDDEFTKYGLDNIICYSGKDITDDFIKRCFNLDRVFYGKQFQWNSLGIENTIKKFNQMCFVFLDKDRGNIVGYSYWFPVKEELITKYSQNKETLLAIKEEDCSPYNVSPVHLFLGGEAFVPGYDLYNLHKAVEDIFQRQILTLAKKGVKIGTVSFEAVCKYDEEYLLCRTNLKNKTKKDNSVFFYDNYSPKNMYNESKYCSELMEYYK